MVNKNNAVPGDFVEVHMLHKIYEGALLETPEDETGIVLLKLSSGYNIGFIKKDVTEIKLLKKAENKESKVEIKSDSKKPNIGMIITGGTIAARLNPKKGGVDWLTSPDALFKFYPELFKKVNVTKIEVPFMKASEDMDFKDWQKIAKTAEELLNDENIQGIIITHGTDFLHYTSAALTSISDIAEVVLVGHATGNDDFCNVMPGTKVRKFHTSRRDAFKVVNEKPFAKVFKDKIEILRDFNSRAKKHTKIKADTKFEEKVALLKFYPGQDPAILDYYLKEGYKGIVLEMGALGHVSTMRSRNGWTRKLKEVQEKGLIVCATSQCIYGRVDPLVYSNGREILETGVIYLEDMLSETAFVKLGWVLGHEDWKKDKLKIKEMMLKDIAGEFNKRLED